MVIFSTKFYLKIKKQLFERLTKICLLESVQNGNANKRNK